MQLRLQGLAAVIRVQVAGLQLLLVADDLVLLCLPGAAFLLEGGGLRLALPPLQQQLRPQTLLLPPGARRAPAWVGGGGEMLGGDDMRCQEEMFGGDDRRFQEMLGNIKRRR